MIKLKIMFYNLYVLVYVCYCAKITSNNYDLTNFLSTKEFENSQIIIPHIQTLHNNKETAENSRLYPKEIILTYEFPQKNVVTANLILNTDLQGHFIKIQNKNENQLIEYPYNHELCQYRGTIQDEPESDIIISLCGNQINGVILNGNLSYFIHSIANNSKIEHHIIKHSDVLNKGKCGLNTKNYNITSHKYKRSINIVHGPHNANLKSSFVELVLVVDNSLYNTFHRNIQAIHQYCKDLIIIVNGFYAPLNIYIALTGIVIWSDRDEISITSDSAETLQNFLEYRTTKLLPTIPNDIAVLLTSRTFDNRVAGKALLGSMCTASLSGAVISQHSSIIAIVASTVAHEIGHTLGMTHDEDISNCYCQQGKCLMTEGVSASAIEWSHCSKDSLSKAFTKGLNYCLQNKPTKLFESSSCGNGFVEPGEECDCGLPKYCKNKCCNPKTCRLRDRAFCATGECCDLNTCKLKKINTNCRLSNNECDISEYCDGRSEFCPENKFKEDATICDNGLAYCVNGKCGSRQKQCEKIWGPYAETINRTPQNRLEKYTNIFPENYVTFGGSWVHDSNRSPRLCQTADFDISSPELNLGLTPNGATCGYNKMCLNQTCVEVKRARKTYIPFCTFNCYNNGICNPNGTCTCDELFAPPDCADYDYSYYDINEIVPEVKLVQRMKLCEKSCTGNRFCNRKGICMCKKGYKGLNCVKQSIDKNTYTNIVIGICSIILLTILIAIGTGIYYVIRKRNLIKSEKSQSNTSIYRRSLSKLESLFKRQPSVIPQGQLS